MTKYIIKRLLLLIPTFIVITFLVFAMLSVVPGDPAKNILGSNATAEQIQELRHELGLDQNFFVRYLNYMKDLVRGDLGVSWLRGIDVAQEVGSHLPKSLMLAFYAIILTIVIGIPGGVISAAKQYKLPDKITLVLSLIFACVPGFWLGLMCQLLFSVKLNWLPSISDGSFKSMIMPVLTLSAAQIATTVRTTRASMLEAFGQDYVRTAMAKGGTEVHVIIHHVLRNALLPVVTGIGSSFSVLFSAAVIIETVFSYQGIGSLLINAVRGRDVPIVMGTVIFVALIVCVVNLLVDIAYAFVDPRVKQRFSKG